METLISILSFICCELILIAVYLKDGSKVGFFPLSLTPLSTEITTKFRPSTVNLLLCSVNECRNHIQQTELWAGDGKHTPPLTPTCFTVSVHSACLGNTSKELVTLRDCASPARGLEKMAWCGGGCANLMRV